MSKIYFILLFVLNTSLIIGQQTEKEQTHWTTTKGIISLNLSQTALNNWANGGDNSLAFSLLGDFHVNYSANGWTITNYLKLNWGKSKVGSEISKVTDNEFTLDNVLSKNIYWPVKPYVSNTIRTQLVTGYNYGVTPIVKVASFFDPAYIIQATGFIYDNTSWFKTRLGFGFKESFTNKFNNASDNPSTFIIEKSKFETGIQSVTEFNLTLAKNLGFSTKLSLFGRFEDFGIWDVYWNNMLTAKINNFVNVNVNVFVVYNQAESFRTQVKEALQLGISYNLF